MTLFQPFAPITKTSTIELVGADETLAQNNFSEAAAAALSLGSSSQGSGVVLSALLISLAGDILTPAGTLWFFNAAPGHALNASALLAVDFPKVLGAVDVAAGDWRSGTNGAAAAFEVHIPFESLASIYLVWEHLSATSINSAGGDDEILQAVLRIRRDS